MSSKLTDRQKRFCEYYVIDLNITKAAIQAGYSEKTAYSSGQRLLKNVEIQNYIQELMNKRSEKVQITAENVLQSILNVRDSCTKTIPIISKVTGEKMGETMIDTNGALKANELLGKHLKLFTDKVEHTGTVNLNHKSKLIEKYLDD